MDQPPHPPPPAKPNIRLNIRQFGSTQPTQSFHTETNYRPDYFQTMEAIVLATL